jgi:PAS domain S-box-containing protein
MPYSFLKEKRRYQAKLISKEEIVKNGYELTFELAEELEFSAGQYAWVILKNLRHPDPKGQRRAFSITSSPTQKKQLTVYFRARQPMSGYKQTLLELPIGSSLTIEAPFGVRSLPTDPEEPIVFVAGGTGIAPFMSMLRLMDQTSHWRPLTLIYANRDQSEAAYLNELNRYTAKGQLKLVNASGCITAEHLKAIRPSKQTKWFLSGPASMVNTVAALLLKAAQKPDNILCEEFFPLVLRTDDMIPSTEVNLTAKRYRMAVESASNHIVFTDVDGVIFYANQAAEDITGYSVEEMIGSTPRLWGGMMSKEFYHNLWHQVKVNKQSFAGKITNRRKNGDIYTALTRISPVLNERGKLIGFLGTEEDITPLEKADRAKTEFVALASHQLRTPLTAINWYTEMLLGNNVGQVNPSQRKYLQEISLASRHMTELVGQLLNISRLELGSFGTDPVPSDPALICEEVMSGLRPILKEKNLTWTWIESKTSMSFPADRILLRIIFQNLITNAIKYSHSGGEIGIAVSGQKRGKLLNSKPLATDSILMTVTDKGYGIPEDQQSQIFTKFFRADNIASLGQEGTGLGLYIVKLIVEGVGGSVWFESVENKGTTFYVSFPKTGMKKKLGTRKLTWSGY